MIIIYPMLYTSGVSENALPGICTVIEAYLLTYHQAEILTHPELVNNRNRNVNYKVDSRGKITGKVRESYDIVQEAKNKNRHGGTAGTKGGGTGGTTLADLIQARKDLADTQQELARQTAEFDRQKQHLEDEYTALDMDTQRGRDENALRAQELKINAAIDRLRRTEIEINKLFAETEIAYDQLNKAAERFTWEQNDEERKAREEERKDEREDREEDEDDRKESREEREQADEERKDATQAREEDKIELEQIKTQIQVDKEVRDRSLHRFKRLKDESEAKMAEIELKKAQTEENQTKAEKQAKGSVKVEEVNMRSISLEPSTVMVSVEQKDKTVVRELLGVKIVPMRVKSDVKLGYLLTNDSKLNYIMTLMTVSGRSLLKKAWSVFDKMLKTIRIGPYKEHGGQVVTGDPRKDIILGRTGHQGETFITIEKGEDFDEIILSNSQKIRKLFLLGWGNLIITDNVTKQAHFCMKKYNGMCNSLPFLMLYETLKASKSYETLEDIKKQTQSLFKTRPIRIEKILSEAKALNKLNQYRSLREGK